LLETGKERAFVAVIEFSSLSVRQDNGWYVRKQPCANDLTHE
jgi:hypothetical protein